MAAVVGCRVLRTFGGGHVAEELMGLSMPPAIRLQGLTVRRGTNIKLTYGDGVFIFTKTLDPSRRPGSGRLPYCRNTMGPNHP